MDYTIAKRLIRFLMNERREWRSCPYLKISPRRDRYLSKYKYEVKAMIKAIRLELPEYIVTSFAV